MRVYLPTLLVIILDQLSKIWIVNNFALWESREIIGSFIKFSYVRNTGIAFGISVGEWGMIITVLASFAATLFIGYLHWKERHGHHFIVIGLAMILGGAIGNLVDRSTIFFTKPYQGVVDFIDIGFGVNRWYTFNIADSAVTIGIALYILHSIIDKPKINIEND